MVYSHHKVVVVVVGFIPCIPFRVFTYTHAIYLFIFYLESYRLEPNYRTIFKLSLRIL